MAEWAGPWAGLEAGRRPEVSEGSRCGRGEPAPFLGFSEAAGVGRRLEPVLRPVCVARESVGVYFRRFGKD